MSDGLVLRLLQNSSPPQLKTILNGYLDTPECKRNGEFYCSLKQVLLSLQEHGEVSDEMILKIYKHFCLPILRKNFTERVVLYSVYDLTILCCEIGHRTLSQEVLNACFESLSGFSKESTSPSGLPVVVCLDLVGNLIKDGSISVVDETSRDKLFDSLLDVLCKSDELLCARISGGILPLFLVGNEDVTQIRLKKLWLKVKELTEKETFSTSNKPDNLQTYFATICSLFDIFITNSNQQTSAILHDATFWELLQQGIQQQDTLSSKRSMYLLKRALDYIEKKNSYLEVKRENGDQIFVWEPSKKNYWLDIWQEFVLLIEMLSETQVHVIKPVLTRLSKIVGATESNIAALHISWLTTIIHKASLHPNRFLRKWAALEVLTLDLSKTPLLHHQNWSFFLGHFQSMLSEHGLYGKDHDGILGTFSPVGTALSSFYKNCFDCMSKDLHVEFICRLITAIEEQRFTAVPLTCIFYALSNIPEMDLLGLESLERIRTILINQTTRAVTLRLATKGFILTTVANLTNPSLVSWEAIFNLIVVGRLEECLQRNNWLWNRLCSWMWKMEMSRQQCEPESQFHNSEMIQCEGLSQFLMVNLDMFLKDKEVHQDLVVDEAIALGRLIIAASDTIHLYTKKSSDVIQMLLSKIFQNFHDASTRLYMSETKLYKAVTLLTSMLQVVHAGSHANINEVSCDHTKQLLTKSLTQSMNNILNLLQRKLTSNAIEGNSSQDFSFMKLCQELYNFYTANPTMKSSWSQFCSLLETITKANIKTIQDLQGYSNHDSQQWSAMHQSMTLLSWICDIIKDNHVTITEAVPIMLLDAIPTFKLNVHLRKPSNVSSSDGSFQDAKKSTNSWRTSVSGYLGTLWKTVAYFLESTASATSTSSHNQDDKSAREGQIKLTVNSSRKQVLESAIEALDVASSENAIPILLSIGLLIPNLLTRDVQLCSHALDMVWASLKAMWDDTAFWEIYQTTMTVLMNPSLLMLPEDHPLTIKIKTRIDEVEKEGEFRPGIMNVVVEQLSKVWTNELTCSSSVLLYKDLVVELLLHNASIQKSHVIDYHVDAFLRHVLSDQSPLCAVSQLERRNDAEVRIVMTNILLTLNSKDPSLHEVYFQIVKTLLAKDKEISQANIKMYLNSGSHRRKHRAWQAVLVLLPLVLERDTKGACAEEILRNTFQSLEDSNQLSVQNFQQWIIIYILNRFPDMSSCLWNELKHDPDKRLGRISLLATVAMVFTIHCMTDRSKRASFFKRAISAIFPWISTNHRQARVYAQVAVQRLWYYCVKENLELVLAEKDFIEPCLEMMTTINDTLADKVRLLENYFFFDFDPIRDISLETIYLTIPKHSGISEEEWVQPELFEKRALGMRATKALESHGIPLYNKDRHLADFVPEPYNYKESAGDHFHRRIRGEKAPTANHTNSSESIGISDGGNVQKKIIAWKIVPPDEMMMVELQQQRMLSLQKSSGGNLIVVASLIDKAPNLGGLCRTSEIFGVKKLVLGSNEVMKVKDFQNLSVSSSKWVDVEQVRPADLKDYLQTMKRQGYTLIGVEQTANSKPLTQYTFPHDALLLLGNEKEGIPADLIQFLDECVEIPQVGVIRSLNVHVSGALLIWEYTRQRVLCGGNFAN